MLKSENRYKQICCYWRRTVNCDNWHAMAGFREAKGLAAGGYHGATDQENHK